MVLRVLLLSGLFLSGTSADEQEALTEPLPTINDDGVVVVDDRYVASVRRIHRRFGPQFLNLSDSN